MKTDAEIATFLILEKDLVVQMDIQEMLLRSFQGWNVAFVAALSDLPRALRATRGCRIVIFSADEENIADGLSLLAAEEQIAAIIISESPIEADVSAVPHVIVQRPFASSHLLTAVQSVLGHLRSFR